MNTGCNNCSDTWYIGGGCGHVYSGGFCGSCSSVNYYTSASYYSSTGYYNNCNSYYGYGYYYPANYNTGYCYSGLYGGVSYTLIYPFVAKEEYTLESFTPSENRRVVILDSKNGRKHWRIVEERAWMPARIIWDNGVQRTQEGYYTWKVVEKKKFRHKRRNCQVCSPQLVR